MGLVLLLTCPATKSRASSQRYRLQTAVAPHQRLRQPVGRDRRSGGRTALVAESYLVDGLVLPGHDTLDDAPPAGIASRRVLMRRVAAHRAVGQMLATGVSSPGRASKRKSAGVSAPRADVRRVAARVAVEARFGKGDDLQPPAAIVKMDNRVIDDLGLEAGAARTGCSAPDQHDQLAQWHMLAQLNFVAIVHAALVAAIGHRQVLQRALAALVTNGAIGRVAGQDELDDVSRASSTGTVCVRTTIPSLTTTVQLVCNPLPKFSFTEPSALSAFWPVARSTTGADLHQAHATHADRVQLGMVAEHGDVDVDLLGGVDSILGTESSTPSMVKVTISLIWSSFQFLFFGGPATLNEGRNRR